jgi:hypothetical protein
MAAAKRAVLQGSEPLLLASGKNQRGTVRGTSEMESEDLRGRLRDRLLIDEISEKHLLNSMIALFNTAVPVANQIWTYWWCSLPRIGRQRMSPASSTAREIGATFSKDRCVRISL